MALALRNFPENLSSPSIHNGADLVRLAKQPLDKTWSPAQSAETPQVRAYRAIMEGSPNAQALADAAGLEKGVHYIETTEVDGQPRATEARRALEV